MVGSQSIEVTLRHGIAAPVSVKLQPQEVRHLARLSTEEGIDYLLSKVPHSSGFVAAFKETLRDPQSIVEIRQGDKVRVITRHSRDGEIVQGSLSKLEVAVAKANRGG